MAGERGVNTVFTVTDTNENTIIEVDSTYRSKRGMTFFVRSNVNGTARVYYISPTGTAAELDSQNVVGGTLRVLDFDFRIPSARLTFEANTPAGFLEAEGIAYS